MGLFKGVSFSIALGVVGMAAGLASAAPVTIQQQLSASRVPAELIVKFRKSFSLMSQGQQLASLRKTLGAPRVVQLEQLKTDRSFAKVRFASDVGIEVAIRSLTASSEVEYAEPNYRYTTLDAGVPNDPQFAKLWHLANQGQPDSTGAAGKPGMDINVMPVWAEGSTGSKSVVVAVIDTGIDWTHPDLVSNLFTNPGEAGDKAENGIDDDGNGFIDDVHGWNFAAKTRVSNDDQGHGTHCAGSIGAKGNDGAGVVGVNWDVTLMPVKFLDAQGGGTLQGAIESINYATQMKVRVMSNSWGGGGFSQALLDVIQKSSDAGILFVAAAGNDGSNNDTKPTYPASYNVPNIVSVAALDNRESIAGFSNYGKSSVHVAAPGVNVFSTYKGGIYKSLSGTSMACPQVSGIAALLMSVDSSLTYAEIKGRLIKTSTPVGVLRKKVFARGRVNAYQAINNIVPPSTDPDPTAWQDVAYSVESRHPYADNSNVTFDVSVPGAKFIRVVFARIETEQKYDFVQLEDASGAVVDSYTGKFANVETEAASGDSIRIRLKSDSSASAYGFSVAKVQVIR